MEAFILEINSNEVSKVVSVQPYFDILFLKLITQIGDCIRKSPSTHYVPGVGDLT